MNSQKIFLCHANEDKISVSEIYSRLKKEGFDPWLDKEDLLPGQNWREEIPQIIRSSKFVLIFFSTTSVSKRGYVQKEFKLALDVLDEIPVGQIFIIPVRLDECEIPINFRHLHYCDLFEKDGFEKVVKSINSQLSLLQPDFEEIQVEKNTKSDDYFPTAINENKLDQFKYLGFDFFTSIKRYILVGLHLPIKSYIKSTKTTFLRDWVLVTMIWISVYLCSLLSMAIEYYDALLKYPIFWVVHILGGLALGIMIGRSQSIVLKRLKVAWIKKWIWASTLGLTTAAVLGLVTYSLLRKIYNGAILAFIICFMAHLLMASMQWYVIKNYYHRSYFWIVLTPISSVIGLALGLWCFVALDKRFVNSTGLLPISGFLIIGSLTISIISGFVIIELLKRPVS